MTPAWRKTAARHIAETTAPRHRLTPPADDPCIARICLATALFILFVSYVVWS
jgi:hypothetical protein